MPIDFTLTPEQKALQAGVRQFPKEHLFAAAHASYSKLPPGKEQFQSIQPTYQEAIATGMIAR
jgi:hypothetical protein